MNTEAFNILLIDLERAVKRLAYIDVFDSHDNRNSEDEQLEEAKRVDGELEQCRADLEDILDAIRQLKNNAA